MSPKYRVLLAVLLTLAAICSHAVFGQTKIVEKLVHVNAAPVDVSLNSLTPRTCTTNTGAISVTASGGSGNYQFSWTGPGGFTANTEDISNLQEGTYTLRVSADGCEVTKSWEVALSCYTTCSLRDAAAITNTKTCSSADGAIAVSITGGSGAYQYLWYDEQFNILAATKDLVGLRPGAYYLEVTDANNLACKVFFYYTIASTFTVSATTAPNSKCAPPFTGSIVAAASGGSGNYSYTWKYPDGTTAAGGATANALRGGAYAVRVTDNVLGCSAETSVYVSNTAAAVLSVSGTPTASTTCAPGNGAVDIAVTNGSGSYTYTWYNQTQGTFASSLEDLANARPASYSIYVLDNVSGCNVFRSFTVDDRTQLPSVTASATANTACAAPFTGAINLAVSGGGTYTYAWSHGATTEDATALAPGTYDVVVTDKATGCAASTRQTYVNGVVVEDQSDLPLQVSIAAVSPQTTCASPNGSIQASIECPATPTIEWTGPNGFRASTATLTGLPAGAYLLRVSVACNTPPVIEAQQLVTQTNSTVSLNLMDIISDPDNNLDASTVAIVSPPVSGAHATISDDLELSIAYQSSFHGADQLRIRACDAAGACTENTITVTVNIERGVVVYNAVAPHSPGDNKFMRIEHLPVGANHVSIFNRWGDVVFDTHNYTNDVPGRRFEGVANNGKELPTGTYFYKIEFADAAGPLTGYLSLKQ